MANSNYWVKLYHETVTDYKFMRLPDDARLLFYDCLCIAGNEGKGGELPDIDGIAFILRKDRESIEQAIKPLITAGIIVEVEPGVYVLTNFEKRQGAMSGNERIKRYRENKKHHEYESATYQAESSNESCNDGVTNRYTEKEEDKEEEEDSASLLLRDEYFSSVGICQPEKFSQFQVMAEKGITVDDLRGAIAWFRENGKPIYEPETLERSALFQQAKRMKQPRKKQQELKWDMEAYIAAEFGGAA